MSLLLAEEQCSQDQTCLVSVHLIDFLLPKNSDHDQFLLERFRTKFTNQMLGAVLYHRKKQHMVTCEIPIIFYQDRDLFCQLFDKKQYFCDYEKWFIVWMHDYEIMKKIAITSGIALPNLITELKKHQKEVWYKDLTEDFEFWKEYIKANEYNANQIQFASPKILESVGKIKALIEIRPVCLHYLGNKLKKNTELLITACERSSLFFKNLPSNFLTKKMFLNAIKNPSNHLDATDIPANMWDEEIATAIAQFKPFLLKYIPKKFITRKIVKLAIEREGYGYIFKELKDPELRKDEELSIICLKHGGNLDSLDRSVINERVALVAVEVDVCFYVQLSEELKSNLNICMTVLKKSGCVLYEMKDEIKSNREIALQAVKTNAYALYYLPKQFLNDREIVLTAFSHSSQISYTFDYDPCAYYFYPPNQAIQRTTHLCERERYPPLIDLIPKEFYFNDRELVMQMTKQFPKILTIVSKDILDREFWKECLSINGNAFEYITPEFKNDFDLCCIALKSYRNSIIHFPEEIQSDRRMFNLLRETVPHNKEFMNKLAIGLKEMVIELAFWARSYGKCAQNIGKLIDSIPNSDLRSEKMKAWRNQDLEEFYYGCYVP